MRPASCLAPAKINLALHVTGRRADGYHELDTLVAFCALADRIHLEAGEGRYDALRLTGHFAAEAPPDAQNLALKAIAALRQAAAEKLGREEALRQCPPVVMSLEKNLPVSAGIGGGSADAAAALLAAEAAWGITGRCNLFAIAEALGADVPMCLEARPLHATGTGTCLVDLSIERDWPVLLVNPRQPVVTAEVFRSLNCRENAPIGGLSPDRAVTINDLADLRNDLEAAAQTLLPVIGEMLAVLEKLEGCRLARMSGSGATCFAIFDSPPATRRAAERLAEARPDWWCRTSQLLCGPMPERLTVAAPMEVRP